MKQNFQFKKKLAFLPSRIKTSTDLQLYTNSALNLLSFKEDVNVIFIRVLSEEFKCIQIRSLNYTR